MTITTNDSSFESSNRNIETKLSLSSTTTQSFVDDEIQENFRRSSLEIIIFNILIPLFALASIGVCLLPQYGILPGWIVFGINFVLATQIAILTHELIHEPNSKTNWNYLLRLNLHLYSPFTFGFAEYKKLHCLHHAHANDPEQDPDYFFIQGGRLRAFICLAFAPEYLFFYALRKGKTQPGFYILQSIRIAVFLAYIYFIGLQNIFFLFFIPSKLSWGIGFLLFSYESHISSKGDRDGNYNLEPHSGVLRNFLKLLVGPYAYYVAFSHASHHMYPQISGRKIGQLLEHLKERGISLPARQVLE
ncbi:fatty acid desaturase [Pelatocladus sp. BLCC-F211]|uniref:fatty acid desaturase n=1 Tax=Pelatocladus sp. BLCC-F211 TaxID=3342752 RepID=UPI0035B6C2EE